MRFSERFKNFSFSPSCQRRKKNAFRVTVKILKFWEKRDPKQEREKEEIRDENCEEAFCLCCVLFSRKEERRLYIKGGERKGAALLLSTRFQRTIYLLRFKADSSSLFSSHL